MEKNLNSTFSASHIKITITFDVLDQFQENKVFQAAQMVNNFEVKYRIIEVNSFVTMETVPFF